MSNARNAGLSHTSPSGVAASVGGQRQLGIPRLRQSKPDRLPFLLFVGLIRNTAFVARRFLLIPGGILFEKFITVILFNCCCHRILFSHKQCTFKIIFFLCYVIQHFGKINNCWWPGTFIQYRTNYKVLGSCKTTEFSKSTYICRCVYLIL